MPWREKSTKVDNRPDWQSKSRRVDPIEEEEVDILPSFQDAAAGALLKVGEGLNFVDKYTAAPVRGLLGTGEFRYPLATKDAPSGKDLMSRLGVSEEEYAVGPVVDPVSGRRMAFSPAGVTGGLLEAVTDPLTYLGAPLPKLGRSALEIAGKTATKGLEKVGTKVGDYAAEKAVTASVGKGRRALEAAKIDPNAPGSIDRVLRNMSERGKQLMRKDDAGGPVLGFFSSPKGVAERSAKKRDFYGDRISQTDRTIDELVPEGVNLGDLAHHYLKYADSLDPIGTGRPLADRITDEAEHILRFRDKVQETGGAPVGAARTRSLKRNYPHSGTAADPLERSAAASDEMNQILQDNIRINRDKALKRATSEEELALLNKFDDTHKKYGAYSDFSELATKEAASKFSPSTAAFTIGGAAPGVAAAVMSGGVSPTNVLLTASLATGAYLAKTRGPAFVARTADAISRTMMAPQMFGTKYQRLFQQAASKGAPAVVGLHHQLLNSDSAYRDLTTGRDTEE